MQWHLENTYFGATPALLTHLFYPESLAYYCPDCGEVWFRAAQANASWFFIPRRCPSHGSAMLRSYSQYPNMLDIMPLELLKREAYIHLSLLRAGQDPDLELICDRN